MLIDSKPSCQLTQSFEQGIQFSKNNNQDSLSKVSAAVAQATIKWMQLIAQNGQDALQNYSKDNTYLQKNMWYAEDLWKACASSKQPKMIEYIKKDYKQHIGFVSPKHFDKILKNKDEIVQIKYRGFEFLVKPDVLPSVALKAAIKGLSILECGMACQIARYGALHDVLGEKKFNILFGKDGQLMNIGLRDEKRQPMCYFLTCTEAAAKNLCGEPGNRPVKSGQLVYFKGVLGYDKKYPHSSWGGLNAICINDLPGQQKFVAFGTDPEGNTEEEICRLLYDNYKKDEYPFLTVADDLISFQHQKQKYDSFNDIAKNYIKGIFDASTKAEGYVADSPQEFIEEIIRDLVELPLEKVSMDFVRNHPINQMRIVKLNQISGEK